METMKQPGLWRSLGIHGSLVVVWWLCISSSGETRNFFKSNLTLAEGQGQLPPKTIGILTKLFCTSGPNFVITYLEWVISYGGQAQNGVNSPDNTWWPKLASGKSDDDAHMKLPVVIFSLYNKLFIQQVLCTLINRRRSLYFFLIKILLTIPDTSSMSLMIIMIMITMIMIIMS